VLLSAPLVLPSLPKDIAVEAHRIRYPCATIMSADTEADRARRVTG
jgi:hypothetical protein